jgi:hypothetical protein
MTPAWILDVLAALMLVVAAVSAVRIVLATPWRRDAFVADTDVAHLLMAIAMAGMLAPSLGTLPDSAWEVVFCVLAAWFVGRVARDAAANGRRALAGGHCAPHLVHSASMLYMFLAATVPATLPATLPAARTGAVEGMGGMSAGAGSAAMTLSLPTLAFVFAFILVGYAVWDLDQLSGRRYATAARVSLAGADPGNAAPPGLVVAPAGIGVAHAGLVIAPAGIASAGVRPAGRPAAASAEVPASADSPATQPRGSDGAPRMGGAAGFLLSPSVTVGCRIAMGVTMAFMLLIAL